MSISVDQMEAGPLGPFGPSQPPGPLRNSTDTKSNRDCKVRHEGESKLGFKLPISQRQATTLFK